MRFLLSVLLVATLFLDRHGTITHRGYRTGQYLRVYERGGKYVGTVTLPNVQTRKTK